MSVPTLVDFDEVVAQFDPVLGLEVHVELSTEQQDVLRLPDRLRRGAEHPGLPRVPGTARVAAGGQPHGCRVGDADRPGAELHDRAVGPVRAEELLLPRHAQELPDQPVRRADRRARLVRCAARRRLHGARRDRAGAHGGRHGQVAARGRRNGPYPGRRVLAAGLQPGRRPADRDRDEADRRHAGAGARGRARLRHRAARPAARARRVRRADGPGVAALRRERVADAEATPPSSARAPRRRTSTRCGRSSAPCATR